MEEQVVTFRLDADLVVLIDPLALDGLREILTLEFAARVAADPGHIRTLPGGLRVGVHRVTPFTPGTYRISSHGFDEIVEEPDGDDDFRTFDIDTGTVVMVDVHHLPAVAKALTWERYDWALRSPLDDSSRWEEIARDAGGNVLGILFADSNSSFPGDGCYRLREDAFASASAPTEPLVP